MNGTPPEASTEYSREDRAFRARSEPSGGGRLEGAGTRGRGAAQPSGHGLRGVVVAIALAGALLLIVAEFTTLFTVHTAAGELPGHSTSTGAHNDYALIPIALLVALLSYGFYVAGSRPALLAIGFMGVLALLIALLGDLPDAHATGIVGGGTGHFVIATAKPSAGLFMETAGALLLLLACVCGFVLIGAPAGKPEASREGGPIGAGPEGGGTGPQGGGTGPEDGGTGPEGGGTGRGGGDSDRAHQRRLSGS